MHIKAISDPHLFSQHPGTSDMIVDVKDMCSPYNVCVENKMISYYCCYWLSK